MSIPARPTLMHQSVYDKLVGDAIPDSLKVDLLNLCDSCDCEIGYHSTAIEKVFCDFASKNRDSGSTIALDADEIVGHVKLLRPAASYLSKQMSVDSGLIENMFRWAAGNGSPFAD